MQPKKQEIDLFKIVEDYFERMLDEVPGMKCLILDRETMGNLPESNFFWTQWYKGMISLICSQSQILKKNVYLVETIENPSSEQLQHLSAIYFIRPTGDNIMRLTKELKEPRFREYNICKPF